MKKTDEIIKEETKDQIELDTEPKTIAEPEPEPVIESESAPKPAAKSQDDAPEFFQQKDKVVKKKSKTKSQD